ncbi:MAG: hypothetical protein UIH18_07200, partial [Fibrobacteraceae bacterium]|nr:hypothetical protein [Fibrobacteraceae bacterium]
TSVARGRLIFRLRGKIFSFHRNDKNRTACVKTGCHGEESFKTTWHLTTSCHVKRSLTCHGERPCASWPSWFLS